MKIKIRIKIKKQKKSRAESRGRALLRALLAWGRAEAQPPGLRRPKAKRKSA